MNRINVSCMMRARAVVLEINDVYEESLLVSILNTGKRAFL
jgi:hypothetical protein